MRMTGDAKPEVFEAETGRLENEPAISVLVAVYNTRPYLERCIESLLNQTYRNFEIIVVDDCSPDGAGELADALSRGDRRITVVHHDRNQGLSGARNTGLDHAKGDLITFIDSDDWVEPDYLAYLYSVMKTTDADVSLSRNFFTSRLREQIARDEVATITPEDMLCDILYNRIHVGVWNRLYRKSVIGDRRFRPDAKTGEGMQFNTQVIPHAGIIGTGLRRVYTYNVDNEGSATKRPNVEKQAYGSVATMDIIRYELSGRSRRLDDAIEYQYFTTALYALGHLVRAGAVSEHTEFYRQLVRYVRSAAPKTIRMEINGRQKLKSLLVWLSPSLETRASILWRYGLGRKQRV